MEPPVCVCWVEWIHLLHCSELVANEFDWIRSMVVVHCLVAAAAADWNLGGLDDLNLRFGVIGWLDWWMRVLQSQKKVVAKPCWK